MSVWTLAYFRQIYEGRVETTLEDEAYVVPLTGEKLCSEFLHLAWSRDGQHWTPLHANASVWPNPPQTKVVRDPFVNRGADGWFHLVATGGRAPTDVFYARSRDLIHWEDARAIPVMGGIAQARNAWAPEWVYDSERGDYFLAWSTSFGRHGWDDSRIWYARTTDFRAFTPPQVLFDPGYTVINARFALFEGRWYMIYKDERFGAKWGEHRFLKVAVAPHLDGPYAVVTGPITPSLVEGPALLRLPGRWLLAYDYCMGNDYGASESVDLLHWQPVPDVSFPPNTRHGSAFEITEAELTALQAHFDTPPVNELACSPFDNPPSSRL